MFGSISEEMTDSLVIGAASAMWLGILTSISPCPLATNIAAMSFIGRGIGSPKRVVLTGVFYTLGRMLAYAALAALLISSVLAVPEVSFFLEMNMNKVLGPLLIAVGLLLLDIVPFRFSTSLLTAGVQNRVERLGLLGSGLLGVVFAMSFCPVSAALYFGSLLPLAMSHGSTVALPSLYGIGTGLPVFGFAVLLAVGAQRVSVAFNRLAQFEKWARRITGVVFVLVGLKLVLNYIFQVGV
jgi:cytochrome c-type biogenesis protein